MNKKAIRLIGIICLFIVSAILGLALVGMFAQAAGLVDDAVSANNLYSQYPLMNYQLDFYVDNSWGWLPWNWKDGIGKSVMYGLYCITNFLWIISLYISSATGYVVQQAYKLDFISDMAETIGKNIQIIAGINEHGFQSSGYYVGFLLLLILILGIYITYVGLLKKETSKAVQSLVNFILIFVLTGVFIAGAPTYIKKINEFSSDISTATLDLSAKIIIPDSDVKGQDSVDLIRDCLFSIQVKQPWMLLQFGDSDESKIGKKRVEKLLAADPKKNNGEDREEIVKNEIEKNNNSNLTITEVVDRLGMVAFLFLFNTGISVFIFCMSGIMIFSQVLFIIYAMLLPVSFVLSLVPSYNGNVKKAIEKIFNVIMMRAGITLIVTVTFSISTMFYNVTAGYPFFMIAFLQVVLFAGVFYYWQNLISMFGLNASDTQQLSNRITRRPYMFMRRHTRRIERKMGRSIERSLESGGNRRRRSAPSNNSQQNRNNQSGNERNVSNVNIQGQNRNPVKHENNISGSDKIRNSSYSHGEKENTSEHSSESRPNVKTTGERIGNKIGAVIDTKNRVRDNVKQLKENVKDAPVHSAHKVYEQKEKVRENISGFKRGIEEEKTNRQTERNNRQKTYEKNVADKRKDLQQERVRKNIKKNGIVTKNSNGTKNGKEKGRDERR